MQPFNAKLDQWELRILDISDTVAMAIARHEFVFTDGANLQHMGNRPREISFRAFFYGNPNFSNIAAVDQATYINHYDFINAMDNSTISHTLIHPKYGEVTGYVRSMNIVHNDTQDYVSIDIQFEQDGIQTPGELVNEVSLAAVVDANALQVYNNFIAQTIPNALSSSGLAGALGKVVNFTQTLRSQITGVTSVVNGFLGECDTVLNQLDTAFNNVVEPIDTLDSSVSYLLDVPSRLVSSVNHFANRLYGSLSALSNKPVNALNSAVFQMDALKNTITGKHSQFFQDTMTTIWSASLTRQATSMLVQDDKNYANLKNQEGGPAWDLRGRQLRQIIPVSILTVSDIESIGYIARVQLQKAVVIDRTNIQVKNIAKALIDYIDETKFNKRKQITIHVNQMPLHMICLSSGLDYHRADRLLGLNPSVLNPTFCQGAIQTYAK